VQWGTAMRPIFARGTLTWGQRAGVGLLPVPDRDRPALTLIEQVLLPQHTCLGESVDTLRAEVAPAAFRDRTIARVVRRAAGMLDGLAELMLEHFEHEERAVFPFLVAGRAPIGEIGRIHDHHAEVEDHLRRLRALSAELRSAREVTADSLALFEGLSRLDELAERHRDTERAALLACCD